MNSQCGSGEMLARFFIFSLLGMKELFTYLLFKTIIGAHSNDSKQRSSRRKISRITIQCFMQYYKTRAEKGCVKGPLVKGGGCTMERDIRAQ